RCTSSSQCRHRTASHGSSGAMDPRPRSGCARLLFEGCCGEELSQNIHDVFFAVKPNDVRSRYLVNIMKRLLLFLPFVATTLSAQTARDPLGGLVAEALHNNLGLAAERLDQSRAASEVSAARGLFFPSLTLDSRYSRQGGTVDLGTFINPAFAALNQL